jgi:hypothetical protein
MAKMLMVAVIATAAAGPLQVRRSPAHAGPTRLATPSVHPVITLAAVNSSGARTTAGSSAAWGDRVMVRLIEVRGASTNTTTVGAPRMMAVATAAIETACSAYPTRSTALGLRRSTNAPMTGASTMHGTSWTSTMTVLALTPP